MADPIGAARAEAPAAGPADDAPGAAADVMADRPRRVLHLVASDMRLRLERAPTFAAYLDGEFVVRSAQPLYDGARELLARGYDPETLLTLRHAGAGCDSFKLKPIGELARWTVEETRTRGLRLRRWRPPSERGMQCGPLDRERASRPCAGAGHPQDRISRVAHAGAGQTA